MQLIENGVIRDGSLFPIACFDGGGVGGKPAFKYNQRIEQNG